MWWLKVVANRGYTPMGELDGHVFWVDSESAEELVDELIDAAVAEGFADAAAKPEAMRGWVSAEIVGEMAKQARLILDVAEDFPVMVVTEPAAMYAGAQQHELNINDLRPAWAEGSQDD